MFYTMYLSSVCQRRQWPDPAYEPFTDARSGGGIFCSVRVNNRVYRTDVGYASETLARDGAAQKAYMICRNFSANDGMYPGQRPGQGAGASGIIQGLPVAIGTGRRGARMVAGGSGGYDSPTSADGTSSGGNSPKSVESGFEQQLRQVTPQTPRAAKSSRRGKGGEEYMCYCHRGAVRAYGRCEWCLRENRWA